jgi:hypothetical protein
MVSMKHEEGMNITRITTIPMPHRGKQAVLRNRPKDSTATVTAIPKTQFAKMSSIDLLKWGLDYKRNVKKAWLRDLLVREKLENTKEAKNLRVWQDYQAQCLFIQGMQAVLGEEFDPRVSKQGRTEDGGLVRIKMGFSKIT